MYRANENQIDHLIYIYITHKTMWKTLWFWNETLYVKEFVSMWWSDSICGCVFRMHRQIHWHLGWKVHDQAAEECLREDPWPTGGRQGPTGFLQVQMLDMIMLVTLLTQLIRHFDWHRNPLDFSPDVINKTYRTEDSETMFVFSPKGTFNLKIEFSLKKTYQKWQLQQ